MIKGVNKRIIEINNPESVYFEKAVFYLKPSVRELPNSVTHNEIDRVLGSFGLEYFDARRKKRAHLIFAAIAFIVSVGGIAAVFLM